MSLDENTSEFMLADYFGQPSKSRYEEDLVEVGGSPFHALSTYKD